jgi:hypothetical protein
MWATRGELGAALTPSLTRLLEGLRKYEVDDPRARLVEKVFKRHVSGSMWSVRRPEPPARAEASDEGV